MQALERTNGRCVIKTKADGPLTQIDVLRQEGAFKARQPAQERSMQGSMEMILINSAGGLTGGDRMSLAFEGGAGTRNTITTQAFEKCYKSAGGAADIRNELSLRSGADLRWLPQETVLFDRSRVHRRTHVAMPSDASLLLAETVILGRLAREERYTHGVFSDEWRVAVDGGLVHREAVTLRPGEAIALKNKAILNGGAVFSTIMAIGDQYMAHLEALRAALAEIGPAAAGQAGGVSAWRVGGVDKLIIRLIARSGYEMRNLLIPVLTRLCGGVPLPRAWSI